jgi:hypothetical protein
VTGIDISADQAEDVPGDWEFFVVKLSEGHKLPNFKFDKQWSNAARTTRGVFHYALPADSDGTTQANFFADQALIRGFQPERDIWQLDCEDGLNEGVTTWREFIIDFMTVGIARLGKRGFLYTGEPFLKAHAIQDLPFTYLLWFSDYGKNDGADHGFPPGIPVVIHQFTSHGNLDQNKIINPLAYAQPGPLLGAHPPKVVSLFHPALTVNLSAWIHAPQQATTYLVQPDGALFCLGQHVVRGMNGHKDFVNREAARLELPNAAEKAAGKIVVLVDTTAKRFALPAPFVPA